MSDTAKPFFQTLAISKSFPPAVQALIAVDVELHRYEVHALLGENGAGKSTLSRIISGIATPDTGEMLLDGRQYAVTCRVEAERLGVRMVTQELNLIPTLSVAENIFFHRMPHRLGFINRRRLHQQAAAVLADVGLANLDPATPTGRLGVGQQQMVEIAAGLSARCDILILDEPTAALTLSETDLLFQQIARLKAAGVAIVYITHRMAEIARIADRITILRDGRVAGKRNVGNFNLKEVIRLMVGRDADASTLRKSKPAGEIALRVVGLHAPPTVRDVSFALHRGEILGFAGLMGSGRTETMRLIFGADRKDGGGVYLNGSTSAANIRSPHDAVSAGIALLTEDRKGQGLLLPWPLRSNTTLPAMFRVTNRAGWIIRHQEAHDASVLAQTLGIRCASIERPVKELSGGNQQKVVIAKWLYRDSEILIFDEPTRGIDVGAKFEIYRLLVSLAERGKAIIVVSSELPELMLICNRIAVMSEGSLTRIFSDHEFDPDTIMSVALSSHLHPRAPETALLSGEARRWES
jgi:ribose transport system ATP-binding protein